MTGPPEVFISYANSDGLELSRAIRARLVHELGGRLDHCLIAMAEPMPAAGGVPVAAPRLLQDRHD